VENGYTLFFCDVSIEYELYVKQLFNVILILISAMNLFYVLRIFKSSNYLVLMAFCHVLCVLCGKL
jgi:hypothetical protein